MKQRIIAGNWKMNTNIDQALGLARDLLELDNVSGITEIIIPPFVSLYPMKQVTDGSSIELGAQNLYFEPAGAFTGEISPAMLADLCSFVLIGHSERRHIFKETDDLINKKVCSAQTWGLNPILCVGETSREKDSGQTCDVISCQLALDLENVDPFKTLVIAYEPVWAIGTGKPASAPEAANTISFIREVLADKWNSTRAESIPILYGGSSSSKNISDLCRQHEIDGVLVGKASLDPTEFIAMAREMAGVKTGSA